MANYIPNEKLEKIKNKFVKTQLGRNNEFREQMGKTNVFMRTANAKQSVLPPLGQHPKLSALW